jgi:hypothetical protein
VDRAGTSATGVAALLRAWFCLDRPTAALITEYAAAEGSHHIPGGEGRRLVYRHGSWHITRKDGT